jgi:hypothetical protein
MPEIKRKTAMISSTSLDLPEHRQQAIDACLRQGIFPIAIEHLPARDADAIRVSLEMVDEADIYIGIYAWRYGHIPDGHDISITEMELNRAEKRGIPILIFTIHHDHPLTITMVETDKEAQAKLNNLKERACQGRGRLEYKSPVELRSHIVQSLGALHTEEEAARREKRAPSFHPPDLIPTAPLPYIAHPYSLLQTREVVGRRAELNLLTDWVTGNQTVPRDVRLFTVVAVGGMGKSALTWKWFNDMAPNELPHLEGRMWWSFYESDAYFENFVIRTLAYATGSPEAEVRQIPPREREDQLWQELDQRPFLLVLDGLERILLAYARMDAAHLPDDDLDQRTANDIVRFYGLSDEVKETYLERHRLRQCADPRVGYFLQRLVQVRASHLLISTRLYPAELQTNTAQPRPGCYPHFLTGLSDDDALALWRAFIGGARNGTSEQLLPLFRAFGNYPLLLRALAGEVAEYKPAPGNFDRWRQAHANFNPAALPLAQRAWELAHVQRQESDFIQTARLHGEAALGLGDLTTATDRLHHALTRARAVKLVDEELAALTALAELHRQQQYDTARELLDQVWTPAERGPYPLIHADTLNVLAQLERDQGRHAAAVAAATEAYKQAWCHGPPYAYHLGLSNARRHLQELGAPEPAMPPFDASKHAPMPAVEIDPEDEFHVGNMAEA